MKTSLRPGDIAHKSSCIFYASYSLSDSASSSMKSLTVGFFFLAAVVRLVEVSFLFRWTFFLVRLVSCRKVPVWGNSTCVDRGRRSLLLGYPDDKIASCIRCFHWASQKHTSLVRPPGGNPNVRDQGMLAFGKILDITVRSLQ